MRAKHWAIDTLLFTSLAVASVAVVADTGSGSGKALTPYRDGETIDVARVQAARREANTLRALEQVAVNGSQATKSGYKVGFACVAGGKLVDEPRYAFAGKDAQGAAREIALSDVEAFQLIRVAGDEAVLEVTQFPAIEPGELLKTKPTYSALVKTARRVVPLTAALLCGSGGELSVVGTDWDTETTYRSLFRVRDVKPGRVVTLRSTAKGGGYWWAVPSVTADKAYPHRVIMKR